MYFVNSLREFYVLLFIFFIDMQVLTDYSVANFGTKIFLGNSLIFYTPPYGIWLGEQNTIFSQHPVPDGTSAMHKTIPREV
jgi:hypothetical protein